MHKKIAFLGAFLGIALIFSYIESLIPISFGIPGIKLGLANSLMVLLLYLDSPKNVFILSLGRVLLAGFMFGNPFSILYSLSGATLSLIAMIIMKNIWKGSMITTSVMGGIFHNLGQLLLAMILMQNKYIFIHFLVLFFTGALSGFLIGILCKEIYPKVVVLFPKKK